MNPKPLPSSTRVFGQETQLLSPSKVAVGTTLLLETNSAWWQLTKTPGEPRLIGGRPCASGWSIMHQAKDPNAPSNYRAPDCLTRDVMLLGDIAINKIACFTFNGAAVTTGRVLHLWVEDAEGTTQIF